MSTSGVSRRDWFRSLLPSAPKAPAAPVETVEAAPTGPQVAVISGRNCLAYQRSFCSSCVERCPVEGAITSHQGLPRVNADACTGCRICYDVCPAPTKAILIINKPANLPGPNAAAGVMAYPSIHTHVRS